MTRAALLVVCLAACDGVSADLAFDEPLRVPGARFVEGPLPGEPPELDGATAAPTITPAITIVETQSQVVRLGQAGKRLNGRTSTDAAAVGIAFAGEGTGYWVSTLGPADPTANDELTWTIDASLGWDLPLGPGGLDIVAIDESGRAGRQQRIDVCVRPDLLDGGATCDPALAPPDTVLTLSWDAPVDLDLWLRTPDGTQVDASHPSTVGHAPPITSAELAADGVGILDHDANGGCRIDGSARESIVWRTAPPPGTYLISANLTDACGQVAAQFRATLYRAQPTGDGTSRLVEVARQDGRLTSIAANGGRGPALFLFQVAL